MAECESNNKIEEKYFGGTFVDNGGAALGWFISLLDVTNIINYNTISLLLCMYFTARIYYKHPTNGPKISLIKSIENLCTISTKFYYSFVVGATNPAIRMLGPVFGQDMVYTITNRYISFTSLDRGVLYSIGYLADRFDRRLS